MTINTNPFPLQLKLVQNAEPPPPRVYAEEPVRKAVPVKNPKLHSAVVGYFSGLVRNFPDKKMADRIIAATTFHMGLPLITKDHQIQRAGIQTIW